MGRGGGEVALDPVRRGRRRGGPAAVLAAPAAVHSFDGAQAHQPGDPLAVPGVAAVADLGGQPAGAIDPAVLLPRDPGGLDGVGEAPTAPWAVVAGVTRTSAVSDRSVQIRSRTPDITAHAVYHRAHPWVPTRQRR